MDELKTIWKANTLWQNICWIGNVVWLLIVLPYFIIREMLRKDNA